jgi:hypothetical protein
MSNLWFLFCTKFSLFFIYFKANLWLFFIWLVTLEKNGLIEKKGCLKMNVDFRNCNPFFLSCKTDDDCRETGHQQRVCCISAYCGTYCADPINSNV